MGYFDKKNSIRVENALASTTLLTVVYGIYHFLPYYQKLANSSLRFFAYQCQTRDLLPWLYFAYAFALWTYYAVTTIPERGKSVYCLIAIKKMCLNPQRVYVDGLSANEQLGLLSIALKSFFAPLMVPWLLEHTVLMLQNGLYIFSHSALLRREFLFVFNKHGFWFLFQIILFLDVLFFTIGYLVELPRLHNQIRSVDSTFFGWAVALLCYPPFSSVTKKILGWHSTDFPHFDQAWVHIGINLLILLLMTLYSWASIALNFKASNLTHRGVVACGPYRFIRHPAYFCKNMAWWLATLPAIIAGVQAASAWTVLITVASMTGWSLIYILRALTEEAHLKSVDGEYAAYCEKVRYRFIPGLI